MKINYKKIVPYVSALVLFLIIALMYFPAQLEGKKLAQHDKKTWLGGSQEIRQFEKETGEHSFWTNSMFGGMPTYLVSNYAPSNVTKHLYSILEFNQRMRPASFVFLYLLGFFIALLLFDVKPWLSIVGAIAFAFSSYFFIIIEAGHITKVVALAFMPPIIAGIYHAYKKNILLGTLVTTVFLALQLLVNHLQITYYTLLIILLYLIFEFVNVVREKSYTHFIKASLFLLAGALIAVSTNFSQIITTYDYGKDSIRGKSELTNDKHNKTSGLDKDYATAWSYGQLETLDMFIPNLMGGASSGELSKDSHTYKKLKQLGVPNADKIVKQLPLYWGPQSFTSGPVYVGALVFFLFVLSLFLLRGNIKWWLISATALSILLAWGKNFMFLTDFFLDYFPMYNKFRTVSMILVIAQFTMPLAAILVIKDIVAKKIPKEKIIKALIWSLAISVGLVLILLIPGILSYKSEADATMFKNWPADLVKALEADRKSMFQSDAFRSIIFMLIGATLLWLYVNEKLKKELFFAALGIAFLVDLAVVDSRYLNSDDFVSARKEKEPFTKSEADKFIAKDSELDFRVLNLTVSTFNDASTSYFHKSIGGYHGAKLRRYQDLIEHVLQRELFYLRRTLQRDDLTPFIVRSELAKLSALNMLNTKYIIVDPNTYPMMNEFRLGNAWFVDEIKVVENADEEIKAVQNFNPARTAIADKRFKEQFFDVEKDSSASIILTEYKPNRLSYKTKADNKQLAVFSEIYYAKGWKAYVDGKEMPHFRANYVLRAMQIPAGEHTVEFKFEPSVWKVGNTVSMIGSGIFVLFIIGGVFQLSRKKKQ